MESYLVIGGTGFLGRHIVEALLKRGEKNVSTFDIVQKYDDVPHFTGDITSLESVSDALRKSGATTIFHTASPIHNLAQEVYYKVNVDGTKTVIQAALDVGVPRLVYTSSSGVVDDGTDLIDVDERMPYPVKPLDAYNDSKAKGEQAVLEANGKGGLLTVALRPAGIFGPGDKQMTVGLYKVFKRGQTSFQIGNNNNLFDMTYVDNVVYAHLLAADALKRCTGKDPSKYRLSQDDVMAYNVKSNTLTTGDWRVPTSNAKPQGPTIAPTPETEAAEREFRDPDAYEDRPVTRTKFDPLSENALLVETDYPLQVPGQAFFITNNEPVYFWDFARMMWRQLGHIPPRRFVLSRPIAMTVGFLSEWYCWLVGKDPAFTRFRVIITSNSRYFNIEKAKRVLGYEPQVGLEEGVRRTIQWVIDEDPYKHITL